MSTKHQSRSRVYTSQIFRLPSWICTIMVVLTLVLGCVMFISYLSDGAIDPLKICANSQITFIDTDEKSDNLTLKEVTSNFYGYKDMPYDYKAEVLKTYEKVKGEFVPINVTKSSKSTYPSVDETKANEDTYIFTSGLLNSNTADDASKAVVVYTTNQIKNPKNIQKDEKIKFEGKLTEINLTMKTETVGDTKVTYGIYTYYISNVVEDKEGDK